MANKNRSLYILLGAFLATVVLTIVVIKTSPVTINQTETRVNTQKTINNVNNLLAEGKNIEAEELINTELTKNPNNQALLSLLAKICYQRGDYLKSEELFLQLIRLNPDDASSYNNLGLVYAKSGDFKNALINYQKSLELNSKAPLTHLNLSKLYELQKDTMLSQYHFNIARQLLDRNINSKSDNLE